MKLHKLCSAFPQMEGTDFDELVADIAANGLRNPIITLEGKVLDGQNRLKACRKAHVEPTFFEFNGTDPEAFVISQNVNRRHLTTSQRAMVAAALSAAGDGSKKGEGANLTLAGITQAEAATKLKVSERSVKTAARIKKQSPELSRQVRDGSITLHAAEQAIKPPSMDPEAQESTVTEPATDAATSAEEQTDTEQEPEIDPEQASAPRVKELVEVIAEQSQEEQSPSASVPMTPDLFYTTLILMEARIPSKVTVLVTYIEILQLSMERLNGLKVQLQQHNPLDAYTSKAK